MASSTPGLQTYNAAFPFKVDLENQYTGELLPVLYIVENNSTTTDLQKINIVIKPKIDEKFKWGGFSFDAPAVASSVSSIPSLAPSNALFIPDHTQFNLAIAIRPGVLAEYLLPEFSNMLYEALKGQVDANNATCVHGPITRKSDNALVWYCAIKNDMYITDGLTLKLENMSACPGVGARNSQIEFIIGNAFMNDGINPFSFASSIHVDIVNHQGVAAAPLNFTVLGLNTLLNHSTNAQELKIYFETVGKVPVKFGPNTKFTFNFSYKEMGSDIVGFGDRSEVAGILWSTEDSVIPYNSNNKSLPISTASTAKPNFTDQYTPVPTKGAAANGLVQFSQKFKSKTDITNPTYTNLNDVIGQLNEELTKSKNFYMGTTGPRTYATQHIHSLAATIRSIPETGLPNTFIPTLLQVAKPYIDNLVTNMSVVQNIFAYAHDENIDKPMYFNNFPSTEGGMLLLKTVQLTAVNSTQSKLFDSKFEEFYNKSLDPSPVYQGKPIFKKNNYIETLLNRTPNNNFFTSRTNPTIAPNRWSDANFKIFFDNCFYDIMHTVAVNLNANIYSDKWNDSAQGYQLGLVILPSRMLYDMCYDIYKSYSEFINTEETASFLLDCSNGFTTAEWSESYQKTKSVLSSDQISSLIHDNTNIASQLNESNPWANDDFFNYVQSNIQTLVSGITIQSSYVVPSASLFDYFFSSYQHSVTKQALIPILPTLPFYIDPVSCIFNFKNLLLSGDDGIVNLHVKVENLPGYWDTNFQIPIIKSTSILHDKLEIGAASSGANSRCGITGSSQIDFLSSGSTESGGLTPQVSIEEDWGLNLYGETSNTSSTNPAKIDVVQSGQSGFPGRPIKVRDADLLIPEGRLAINGGNNKIGLPVYPDSTSDNFSSDEKLNVTGDSYLNGKVEISGTITLQQNAVFKNAGKTGAALSLDYNTEKNAQSILIGDSSDLGGNWGPLCIALPENAGSWPIVVTKNGKQLFTVDIDGNVTTKGRIKDKTGDVMPVGSIIAYSGSSIPDGWLLCDGGPTTGHHDLKGIVSGFVPDLRSRFIVGSDPKQTKVDPGLTPRNLNDTGGEENHKLLISEMPAHSHGDRWNENNNAGTTTGYNGIDGTHNHQYKSEETGGGGAHNNLPPYFALTYIIKY